MAQPPRSEIYTFALALAVLTALLTASSAFGIVRRHDVADSEYIVDASDYPAVVDLFINEPGDCLATLIAPQWLITAAHCTEGFVLPAEIRIGATNYPIGEVDNHSGWNQDTDDITLIRLESPVTDVDPIPHYTQDDEMGQMVWFVGRGDTSTGDVGGGTADGNTRAATNTVIGVDEHWLRFIFNAPGDPGVTDLEGISGDGDSGGPALLMTANGLRVAGLSSYQENGNQQLGTYGVEEFYTRVSQYTEWIEERVGASPPPPMDAGSSPDADAGVVPAKDAQVSVDAAEEIDAGPDSGDVGTSADAGGGAEPEREVDGGCACTSDHRAPVKRWTRIALLLILLTWWRPKRGLRVRR